MMTEYTIRSSLETGLIFGATEYTVRSFPEPGLMFGMTEYTLRSYLRVVRGS